MRPNLVNHRHTFDSVHLRNTHLPFLIAYHDRKMEATPLHTHLGLEVHYCLAGRGRFVANGRVFDVSSRTLTVLNPLYAHRVELVNGKDPYERYALHILPERLGFSLTDGFAHFLQPWIPWALKDALWQVQVDDVFHRALVDLFAKMESAASTQAYGRACSLVQSLFELIGFLHETQSRSVSASWVLARQIMAQVMHVYPLEVSTGDIAARLNVSASRACHAFRRSTGMTISRYLHETRIQHARRDLLLTTDPVSYIAYNLGYNDVSYFNRWFQRITGMSPTEFKQGIKAPRVRPFQLGE